MSEPKALPIPTEPSYATMFIRQSKSDIEFRIKVEEPWKLLTVSSWYERLTISNIVRCAFMDMIGDNIPEINLLYRTNAFIWKTWELQHRNDVL